MEISPLLAADTAGSVAAVRQIHDQAHRANLFVKIPGTPQGVTAIEQAIFPGIPIRSMTAQALLSNNCYRRHARGW
jgi:transaldolase